MRFLPILLTSPTAIGGLVPLIIEYNPLYSPLAMVLIGGIISSTIAARFVTPVPRPAEDQRAGGGDRHRGPDGGGAGGGLRPRKYFFPDL